MKKINKVLLSIVTSLVVALSLIVPHALAEVSSDDSIIRLDIDKYALTYVLKDKENPNEGQIGEDDEYIINQFEEGTILNLNDLHTLRLDFHWQFEKGDEGVIKDKKSIIPLPDILNGRGNEGNLYDLENGTDIIATYKVNDDNQIVFTYTDFFDNANSVTEGQFYIFLSFTDKAFDENTRQEIDFGNGSKVSIEIHPSGDHVFSLDKKGKANAEVNAEYIDWTIYLNTNELPLKEVNLTDYIPEGLELDLDSVTIDELIIGNTLPEDGYTKAKQVYPPKEGSIFDVSKTDAGNLEITASEIERAYEITYRTYIQNPDLPGSFENKADLSAKTSVMNEDGVLEDQIVEEIAKNTVQTQVGSMIEKTGEAYTGDKINNTNSDKIIWNIDVNKSDKNLGDVYIEDVLSPYLDQDDVDFKIINIDTLGNELSNATNPYVGEVGFSNTDGTLRFDFEELSGPVRIQISTKVKYPKDYVNEINVSNVATLKQQETDRVLDVTDEDLNVLIKRSGLLSKTGNEVFGGYNGNSYINWNVTINSASHTIKNPVITDKIDTSALSFIQNSFVLTDAKGNRVSATDYELEISSDGSTFTLSLGQEITEKYTLVYKTEIKDNSQTSFSNVIGIGGEGVGTEYQKPLPPVSVKPSNIVTTNKSLIRIDHNNKTISWILTVDARKEAINPGFEIKDIFGSYGRQTDFVPQKLMMLLEDSVEILYNDAVYASNNYTVAGEKAFDEGFKITFNKKLERGKYVIKYTTSFDPNKGDFEVPDNGNYANSANFLGSTPSSKVVSQITVITGLAKNIYKGGYKQGTMGENRELNWSVAINTLQEKFTSDFVITDTLVQSTQENENGEIVPLITQKLMPESLELYKATINEKGDVSKGDFIAKVNADGKLVNDEGNDLTEIFTYTPTDLGYEFKFLNGIDSAYILEYKSKAEGVSQENYSNESKHESDDYNKTYDANIKYDKFDHFVEKSSDVEGLKVSPESVIDWKLKINQSLSFIKDAKVIDNISAGHEFIQGSLKVNGVKQTPNVSRAEDGQGTTLTIELGDIDDVVSIEYQTLVTSTRGQISNSASLLGYSNSNGESDNKEYGISMQGGGFGTASKPLYNLQINKLDDGTLIKDNVAHAEFVLTYEFNGETRIFMNDAQEVRKDGTLVYEGLRPDVVYSLYESKAPEGFNDIVNPDEENTEFIGELVKTFVFTAQELQANKPANAKGFTYEVNVENERQLTSIDISKTWIGGKERSNLVFELNRKTQDGKLEKVQEINFEANEFEGDTWTITIDNLPITNMQGHAYEYSVREITEIANFTKNESGLDVTNTYVIPKINIEGTKIWNKGPAVKPNITLQLFKDGVAHRDAVILKDGVTKHLWENLDETDANGNKHSYTIKEVSELENYTVSYSEDKLTITNTYVSPKTDITGTKKWINGPSLRPDITLQLVRNGKDHLEAVVLENGTLSYTWNELDLTDENGVAYIYTLKELGVPENYDMTANGLEVTNTYVIPKTATHTVEKKWDGGLNVLPKEITVELYRKTATGAIEHLEDEQIVLTADTNWKHSWEKLEATDINGNIYTYSVKEKAIENFVESYNTDDADKTIITNKYVSPTQTINVNKEWLLGSITGQVEIEVNILRSIEGGDIETVETIKLNKENDYSFSKDGYPTSDKDGFIYTYEVEEIEVENYVVEYATLTTDGAAIEFMITNTYVSPLTSVTAQKVWVGGPAIKPQIQLQLYRNAEAYGDPVTLEDGTTSYTWTDLDLTDEDAVAYEYTVDEVSVGAHEDLGWYDITISEDGLTITNTFVSQKRDVTVNKLWIDGPETKPSVEVQLFQNGKAFGEIVELTETSGWTHTWTDLDAYDMNAVAYEYTVEEITTDENYGVSYSDDTFTITNTYQSLKTDIVGHKVWVKGPKDRPQITLQLLRNGEAYLQPVVLKNGEFTHVWKDLDITDKNGVAYVYTLEEIDVPENYVSEADGLSITNTYVSPTRDITMNKVWDTYHEVKPNIKVQLYRNGEALGEAVTLKNGETTHTWKDLPVTDEDGNVYVYTVDETDVPEGYIKTVKGFTISNNIDPEYGRLPITDEEDKLPLTGAPSVLGVASISLALGGVFLTLAKRKRQSN